MARATSSGWGGQQQDFLRPTTVASNDTLWPSLEISYVEEFGPIDPRVHDVAADLWPAAKQLALNALGDSAAGYRLLKRAVAAVSAVSSDRRAGIRDLRAYLFQTYKRLVLAELEKLNGHRALDVAAADVTRPASFEADNIERHILVAELVHRMDPWTKEVFENLTLGYSFDEIGRALGSNPHVIRNRFRLACRRLASAIEHNVARVEAPIGRGVFGSIKRLRTMRARLVNPSGQ